MSYIVWFKDGTTALVKDVVTIGCSGLAYYFRGEEFLIAKYMVSEVSGFNPEIFGNRFSGR
jgi:hypothetical protein